MKVAIRIITAMYLAAISGTCFAVADGPDHFRITGIEVGESLTIHSMPDTNSDKLGEIPPNGNCVLNLGCHGGLTLQEFMTLSKTEQQQRQEENPRWCEVEYQGTKGWVAGRYLAEGRCVLRDEEMQEQETSMPVPGTADAK